MKIKVNRNKVIDSKGGVIKVVSNPNEIDEITAEDNIQIRHTGYLVDYFEHEKPNILAQLGFPPGTNPEEVAEIFTRIQGKEEREAKEIIKSSSLLGKLVNLGTLGNSASVISLIYQAATDENIKAFFASLAS